MTKLTPIAPLTPRETQLLAEVAAGNVDAVRALIQGGVSPNVRDYRMGGETALHTAARQSNLEMTRLLLDEGAHIIADHDKVLPTHRAISRDSDAEAILRLLLDHTPGDPAEALRDALTTASERNLHGIMTMLLERGADPFTKLKDSHYRAVDHIITDEDDPRALGLLLKHRGPQALATQDNHGWSLLFLACACAAPKTVQRLLDFGFEARSRGPVGASPMQGIGRSMSLAITRRFGAGEEAKAHAYRKDAITQTIQLLQRAGCTVGDRNHHGLEPLHEAASRADLAGVEAFLDAGANPNAVSSHLETPLHSAVRLSVNPAERLECVHALLARGCDPSLRDHRGFTAAEVAADRGWSAGATALKIATEQYVLEQEVTHPTPTLKGRM